MNERLVYDDVVMYFSKHFKIGKMIIELPSLSVFNVYKYFIHDKPVIDYLNIINDRGLLTNTSNDNNFRHLFNAKFQYNIIETLLSFNRAILENYMIDKVIELFNDDFSSINKENDILSLRYPQYFQLGEIDEFHKLVLEVEYIDKINKYVTSILKSYGLDNEIWFFNNTLDEIHDFISIPIFYVIQSINIKHNFIEILMFYH